MAGPADAAAVARVHVESWHVAYRGLVPDATIARMDLATRTRFWTERIADLETGGPVFVMDEDGRSVAFCQMVASRDPDDDPRRVGHITSLHVTPDLRGRGHGRTLVEHAIAESRRRGFVALTLWVLETNRAARGFYERLGFTDDGARRDGPGTGVPEVRYRIRL